MRKSKKGQMMVEYALVFTMIVAVVIYAAIAFIRPGVNRLFNASAGVMNQAIESVEATL
ncbi:MAG: hypothetical protein V1863_01235 [Candidatus Omnitrophota bacterium]